MEGLVTQTILHNRTGGLQVLPPGSTEWYYVKVGFGSLLYMLNYNDIPEADASICDMQHRRRAQDLQRRNPAV